MAEIVSFYDAVVSRYSKGKLPLETLIRIEMVCKGYDPNNIDDIETYWRSMIDDEPPTNDIA